MSVRTRHVKKNRSPGLSAGRMIMRRLVWSRAMLAVTAVPLLGASMLQSFGLNAWHYILMILGFSLIILVHELGHFMVARWCSVKCEVFSLGIGHRLLGWRKGIGLTFGPEKVPTPDGDKTSGEIEDEKFALKKLDESGVAGAVTMGDLPQTSADPSAATVHTEKGPVQIQPDTKNLTGDILGKPAAKARVIGETDYRISMLPLGGYVKMLGQDDMDATAVSSDPRSFNRRPIWQRMCIVSAGVVMNVIFAFVVFAIVFQKGVDFPPAVVGDVAFDSAADHAGFQTGDEIIKIDGQGPRPDYAYVEFVDLKIAAAFTPSGEPIHFTVRRDGVEKELVASGKKGAEGMNQIGLAPMYSTSVAKFDDEGKYKKFLNDMGAPFSGLQSEEKITRVGDTDITSYAQIYRIVQASHGMPLAITSVPPGGKPHTEMFKVVPDLRMGVELDAYPSFAGLYPRTRIANVQDDSPAGEKGVPANTIVRRLDSTDYPAIPRFTEAVQKGNEVLLTVMDAETPPATAPASAPASTMAAASEPSTQGASTATAPAAPAGTLYKVTPKLKDGKMRLGVILEYDLDNTLIASADDSNPQWKTAAIGWNSRVLRVNGEPVRTWTEIYDKLNELTKNMQPGDAAKSVTFDIERETGAPVSVTINLPAPLKPDDAEARRTKALAAGTQPFSAEEMYVYDLRKLQFSTHLERALELLQKTQIAHGVGGAMLMGYYHTKDFIVQTYMTLHGLFTGGIPVTELHGALGMAKLGHDMEDKGFIYLVYFLGVISVNLAVANFLPLPIVDGGLFLMLILEKIRGRPLPNKVQYGIQVAGLILLGGVFLLVTVNDIKLF